MTTGTSARALVIAVLVQNQTNIKMLPGVQSSSCPRHEILWSSPDVAVFNLFPEDITTTNFFEFFPMKKNIKGGGGDPEQLQKVSRLAVLRVLGEEAQIHSQTFVKVQYLSTPFKEPRLQI